MSDFCQNCSFFINLRKQVIRPFYLDGSFGKIRLRGEVHGGIQRIAVNKAGVYGEPVSELHGRGQILHVCGRCKRRTDTDRSGGKM